MKSEMKISHKDIQVSEDSGYNKNCEKNYVGGCQKVGYIMGDHWVDVLVVYSVVFFYFLIPISFTIRDKRRGSSKSSSN